MYKNIDNNVQLWSGVHVLILYSPFSGSYLLILARSLYSDSAGPVTSVVGRPTLQYTDTIVATMNTTMLSLGTRETNMVAGIERYSSWGSFPCKALRLCKAGRQYPTAHPIRNRNYMRPSKLWVVMRRRLVVGWRRFGKIYSPRLQRSGIRQRILLGLLDTWIWDW